MDEGDMSRRVSYLRSTRNEEEAALTCAAWAPRPASDRDGPSSLLVFARGSIKDGNNSDVLNGLHVAEYDFDKDSLSDTVHTLLFFFFFFSCLILLLLLLLLFPFFSFFLSFVMFVTRRELGLSMNKGALVLEEDIHSFSFSDSFCASLESTKKEESLNAFVCVRARACVCVFLSSLEQISAVNTEDGIPLRIAVHPKGDGVLCSFSNSFK